MILITNFGEKWSFIFLYLLETAMWSANCKKKKKKENLFFSHSICLHNLREWKVKSVQTQKPLAHRGKSDLLHIPPAWPSAHQTPQRQNSWAPRGPSHWGTQNCCSSGGNSDRIEEREMRKHIQMSERHAAFVRLLTSEAGVVKVETLGWPLWTSIITKPSDTTATAHSPSSSSSARLYAPCTHKHTHYREVVDFGFDDS